MKANSFCRCRLTKIISRHVYNKSSIIRFPDKDKGEVSFSITEIGDYSSPQMGHIGAGSTDRPQITRIASA
jgi:hypothetical protein